EFELVAINDLADDHAIAHLLKYDSIHGKLYASISVSEGKLKVGKNTIQLLSQSDPEKLPWKDLDIDVVIESTGRFTDRASSEKHITAGAKKVIISAPSQ